MKKKKALYPGVDAVEKEKEKAAERSRRDDAPDLIATEGGICPNYDKYVGWPVERVLVWCNID